MKALKYLTVLTLPIISLISIHQQGWLTFLPLLYAFGFIPFLELFMRPDTSNLSKEEEASFVQDKSFDIMIYLAGAFHIFFFLYFFLSGVYHGTDLLTQSGNIFTLGLMCGIFGINIAHELGHRAKKSEQLFAKILLATSLYMHFFIEHNRGHHRYVSTDRDPASAPKNMTLYHFWIRSMIGSYFSAWRLEINRIKRKNFPFWKNNMLWFEIIQLAICVSIFLIWGLEALLTFIAADLIGILLLETVNYIEHYGLRRKRLPNGNYERAMPCHSWNSDHLFGRLLLFELSRHSDHHYLASRKYQILRHHDKSPQLPTGYPGMMILSFFPPLWFFLVHRQLDQFEMEMNQYSG